MNSFPAVATGLRPVSFGKVTSLGNGSQSRGYNFQRCLSDHRFPVRLDSVMFSSVMSAGREMAYATALATSCGEIIL